MEWPKDSSVSPWVYRFLSFALLAAVWELAARRVGSSVLLPPFTAVALRVAEQLRSHELWAALRITAHALLVGFGLSVAVGIPLGVALGRVPALERLASPYLTVLLVAPIAPLVPLIMLIFGLGAAARVAVVFVSTVPMIVVNTATGVRTLDRDLMAMARSFGCPEWLMFRRVYLPGALPAIMAGLRLGCGRAIIGVVIAELFIVTTGVGQLIARYSATFKAADLFATVLIVLLLGVSVIYLMQYLERRVIHWRA